MRRRRSGCLWVLFVPVLCLILLVAVSVALNHTGSTSSRPPSPSSTRSAKPPATPAETAWILTPKGLRADIDDPVFVMSLDGDFQSGYVAGEAGLWLMLTGTESSASTVLHAIDPATGAERWKRALDGALCTTEAPKSGLLCASVLDRDQATGLGTRWQLHLLDPATGADRATRDIDGWLTAVHWTGKAFVLLEQREPRPTPSSGRSPAPTCTPCGIETSSGNPCTRSCSARTASSGATKRIALRSRWTDHESETSETA